MDILKLISQFFFWCIFCLGLWIVMDCGLHLVRLKSYKRSYSSSFPQPFLISFLCNFPRMLANYINDLKSEDFKEHGLYLFCGEQGSGKTMAMTYNINRLLMEYPNVKILTNYNLMCQDKPLESYKPLVYMDNKESGLIFGIDEIQSTWSSRSWSDFPPDMISVICQNRKSHRVIFGTAQNINMVDKNIRLQTRRYVVCKSFLGIIQLCLYYKPYFDFDGRLEYAKLKKIQLFMQDESLRYQYNTFDIIKQLRD